jgi:large conductance mechanosensitive channel
MIKEFKEFALKGNVMDLAVGIIIGAAFTKIVESLVANIITPLIGLILGRIDFKALAFGVGGAQVTYGMFINAVIDFLLVAFVLFLIVRQVNKLKKDPPPDPAIRECPACTTSISSRATRCPSCTTEVTPTAAA